MEMASINQLAPIKTRILELLKAYSDGIYMKDFADAYNKRFGSHFDVQGIGFEKLDQLLYSLDDIVTLEPTSRGYKLIANPKVLEESDAGSTKSFTTIRKSFVLSEERPNVIHVLRQFPEGIEPDDFLKEFRKLIGHNLNFKSLGFQNVLLFAEHFQDMITIENSENSCLFRLNQTLSESFLLPKSESYEVVKEKILNILDLFPEGLDVTELENNYNSNYKCNIPWPQLGFMSINDLFLKLTRDIPNLKLHDGSDVLVLTLKPIIRETPVQPSLVSLNREYADPLYVKLEKIVLSKELMQSSMSGYISHVNSPDDMFIQIKSHIENKLPELTAQMTSFYADNKEKFKIRGAAVKIGCLCAAVFPDDLCCYRAIITGLPRKDFAEVTFVDFGNDAIIPLDDVFYILKDYCKMPAQAISCKMAKILPMKDHWCEKITEQLKQWALTEFIFKMTKAEDNQYYIVIHYIPDPGEKLVCLNDLLVESGLAVLDSSKVSTNSLPRSVKSKRSLESLSPAVSESKLKPSDTIPKNCEAVIKVSATLPTVQVTSMPESTSQPKSSIRMRKEILTNRSNANPQYNSEEDIPVNAAKKPSIRKPISMVNVSSHKSHVSTLSSMKVKKVKIGSFSIHFITHNSAWYFLLREVSAFSANSDAIKQEFKSRLLNLENLIIPAGKCPPILCEFASGPNGCQTVTFCLANDICSIMKELGMRTELLEKELKRLDHLVTVSAKKSSPSGSDENIHSTNIDHLVIKHENDIRFLITLIKRREGIIKDLRSGTVTKRAAENELHMIQEQSVYIQQQIAEMEKRLIKMY